MRSVNSLSLVNVDHLTISRREIELWSLEVANTLPSDPMICISTHEETSQIRNHRNHTSKFRTFVKSSMAGYPILEGGNRRGPFSVSTTMKTLAQTIKQEFLRLSHKTDALTLLWFWYLKSSHIFGKCIEMVVYHFLGAGWLTLLGMRVSWFEIISTHFSFKWRPRITKDSQIRSQRSQSDRIT